MAATLGVGVEDIDGCDDCVRELDQPFVEPACLFLQTSKRFGFVQPGMLHQETLGDLDLLAIFQGLLVAFGFFQRLGVPLNTGAWPRRSLGRGGIRGSVLPRTP